MGWMYFLIIPGLAVYYFLGFQAWKIVGPPIEKHYPDLVRMSPDDCLFNLTIWPISLPFTCAIAGWRYWKRG